MPSYYLPPIKALSEILVETNLCPNQRSASSCIRLGHVRVASHPIPSLMVANKEACLVLLGPTTITCKGESVVVYPKGYGESANSADNNGHLDPSVVGASVDGEEVRL